MEGLHECDNLHHDCSTDKITLVCGQTRWSICYSILSSQSSVFSSEKQEMMARSIEGPNTIDLSDDDFEAAHDMVEYLIYREYVPDSYKDGLWRHLHLPAIAIRYDVEELCALARKTVETKLRRDFDKATLNQSIQNSRGFAYPWLKEAVISAIKAVVPDKVKELDREREKLMAMLKIATEEG